MLGFSALFVFFFLAEGFDLVAGNLSLSYLRRLEIGVAENLGS